MKCKLFPFLFSILFSIPLVNAQTWNTPHWGAQLALTVDIGTHINQIGIKIQGYYSNDFLQFNLGNHIRFNATHFGDRKKYMTQRINTGVVFLVGNQKSRPQLILDGLNHQSNHDYAIAYNYLWYIDNIGTSQKSGGLGFHIKQFSLHIENDLFSGTGRDRYRTSHASLSYHDNLYNFTLNSQLWTGNTLGTKLQNTPDSMYQVGFKDLSTTHYGKTSHGVISFGVDHQLIYGNYASAVVGIDSEQIRHGLQNRFMHDKKFVPLRWRNANVNYPMLNKHGYPVHTKDEAAPSRFFIQFGLNRPTTF